MARASRVLTALIVLFLCALGVIFASPAAAHGARVLRVGSYKGIRGQFDSIQAAVNKAKKGDWILVGPGVYHERNDKKTGKAKEGGPPPAGVLIKKNGIHLRGMSRKKVVVDGTLPHSGKACSSSRKVQNFGVKGTDGKPQGRNGIVVFKANNTRIDNLTVCNFLSGSSGQGNEIWWNGGDGSGRIGMGAFKGTYLNATSTFYHGDGSAASYGIFSSNSSGPGSWYQTYASNFSDAGYYIGACQQVCNQTIDKGWSEFSALGYSGTNAGGPLVVENSQFDNNLSGFVTNSQNNDDAPSPQEGACPRGGVSSTTHTNSCWVFMNNYVHDNNNPNVPKVGTAGVAPVGTGLTVAGGRNDTVMNNRFVHNGAWGVLFVPFPDTDNPPPIAHCEGGTPTPGFGCLYDDWGNALLNNQFSSNGFFGNPSNSDFGEITFFPGNPINCYSGNSAPDGSSPPDLQQTNGTCGQQGTGNLNQALLNEVACNTGLLGVPCQPSDQYPRRTGVVMHKLPNKQLKSMPKPCKGVPRNPWC